MLLAHGFTGGIATYFILKNKKNLDFPKKYLNLVWIFGVIGSIFPDLDLIVTFIRPDISHRHLPSHGLVIYLLFFVLANLLIYFVKINRQNKNLFLLLNLVFCVGIFVHLLIDFFVGGLVLLSPFSNLYFGYKLPFYAKSPDWQIMYFSSPYMVAESIIALWFFDLRKHIDNFFGRNLPILFFVVAVLATAIFMFRL